VSDYRPGSIPDSVQWTSERALTPVRNRSSEIALLLSDVEKIRQERRKAKANKSKYQGTGNDGGMSFVTSGGSRYGGFGSETLGSSRGGGNGEGSGGYGGSSGYENDREFILRPEDTPLRPVSAEIIV